MVAALPAVAAYPVVPLAVGSGVAMVFNFLAARRFAFSGAGPAGSHISPLEGVRNDVKSRQP